MSKLVKDITQEVKEKVEKEYQFPNSIKILNAQLKIDSDGWGGYGYYVMIKYEIDGIQYNAEEQILTDINETLIDILSKIKNFYERMHVIKL